MAEKTPKILVVEDNQINQRVIVGMLKRLGYQADIADQGEAAVEACKDTRYDLIFMDCEMPVMDGYTATRMIRDLEKQQNRAKSVIVALTAHVLKDVQDRCMQEGMDDFVPKPLQLQTVRSLLSRWISAA